MGGKNITFPDCGGYVVFLDINTFYGSRAGGIRTYHQAKLDWFSRQSEHVYCLIYPGPAFRVERPAPSVYLVQVYGPALTRDPQGYRLMLDYWRVLRWIRKLRPEVLEAGDAWLTSWFCLCLRPLRLWKGLRISFYHSDPVSSYLLPWSRRGKFLTLRGLLAQVGSSLFYAIQRRFDWTATASGVVEGSLRRHGVTRIRRLPFGVAPALLSPPEPAEPLRRRGADAPVRLLYSGRLDRDKGVELLLEVLPALLNDTSYTVTVAGRGAFADRFASIRHERYRFAGFLEGQDAVAGLYASHDILLAPGPHETFGLAVLEAMAVGLVVVGPAAGGTGEMLGELNSPFRFPAGESEGFLRKIHQAAQSDLPAWSARHQAVSRHYGTWDDAVERMVAAWRELTR